MQWLVDVTDASHRATELSRWIPDPLQAPKNLQHRRRAPSARHSKSIKVASASQKAKAKSHYQVGTGHPHTRRETYDAIREMHTRISSPIATMGCETAKWKETDPRVRPLLSQLFLTLTSAAEQAFCDARLARAVVADR